MIYSIAVLRRCLPICLFAAGSFLCFAQELPAASDIHGDPLPQGAVARLGTARLRGLCDSIRFTPDGKKLIGIADGRVIRVWDGASGKLLQTRLLERKGAASKSAVSRDGQTLLVACGQELELWDIPSGKRLDVWLPRARLRFDSFTISNDRRLLLLARTNRESCRCGLAPAIIPDQTVLLWDPTTCHARNLYDTFFAVPLALAPDQRRAASFSKETMVWDTATGKCLWNQREGHAGHLEFSPDGRCLITSPRLPGDTWHIWEAETGRPAERMHPPPLGEVSDFAVSPDGKCLLIPTDTDYLHWDMTAGRILQRWPGCNATGKVAFAPDGRSAVTCDTLLRRWDTATGKLLFADVSALGHTREVEHLFFTADGRRLLSVAEDNSLRIWDVRTAHCLHRIDLGDTSGMVWSLTPDGASLVGIDEGLTVRLWSGVDGRLQTSVKLAEAQGTGLEPMAIRVLSDGKTLGLVCPGITAQAQLYGYSFWDLRTGRLLRCSVMSRRCPQGAPTVLSPDGRLVCGERKLFDMQTGAVRLDLTKPRYSHAAPPVFLADGRLLASAQKAVRLWELASGRSLTPLPEEAFEGLAFSPDGRRLACAGSNRLLVWDLGVQRPVVERPAPPPLQGDGGWITSNLAFSPDGRTVATGHVDGTILLWAVPLPSGASGKLDAAALWKDLGKQDPRRGYEAVWRLQTDLGQAIPLFRSRFPAAHSLPPEDLRGLIEALDSDPFEEREKASQRLQGLGRSVEGALRQALEKRPSLEQRRRLLRLLSRLEPLDRPQGEDLRAVRAVAVLEGSGSPEGRKLLREWAGRSEGGWLTQEARRAVERLQGCGPTR